MTSPDLAGELNPGAGRWESGGVLVLDTVPDDPRPWDQIPGVGLWGIVIGLIIVVAAIRYMVKKK